jgi:hypothetical protein
MTDARAYLVVRLLELCSGLLLANVLALVAIFIQVYVIACDRTSK